ncbi:MAG TPA: ABC transporter ATP-binding protein [Pseudolabrys sp.]|nr:ABC transporter ATP-binding protein [Pseudolabrys sp.]
MLNVRDHGLEDAQAAIVCESLWKVYDTRDGGRVTALEAFDLRVTVGEFVTVVGPSGCGKSTLLKLLAGLITRTGGTLMLAGESVEGPRRDIGMVFQAATLLEWRTVLQNVMLPVDVLGLDRSSYRGRAIDLLNLVGLSGFENKYPRELSGGMQQRVALTRGLVHDPTLLLMDEPFGALDALTRESMNMELQRIWMEAGKTVVLITHSISEAVFLADRVAVMTSRPGRLAEIVPVKLPRPRTLESLGSREFGQIVNHIRGLLNASSYLE